MDTNRRSFLIGGGSLISTTFLADAQEWIEQTGRPLLLEPLPARVELFVNYFDEQILFSVGSCDVSEPPPPTWAEFLKAEGYALNTVAGFRTALEEWELTPRDLQAPMNGSTWATAWECRYDPTARAYHLLRDLDLGSEGMLGPRAGDLKFIEGCHPGSSDCWVEAEDHLTVSLLQARLRELGSYLELKPGLNAT